jgi:protoporphyrinogen oxidase
MVLSMLVAKLARRPSANGFVNVEEAIVSRFGERICRHFFRDYIPKVTGLPAAEVSPDWFLERYRFYQENNLWTNLVGKAFHSLTATWRKKQGEDEGLKLFYPARGAQMITDALASRIQERGGTIHLGARVEAVQRLSDPFTVQYSRADGERRTGAADIVISTLPLTELMGMLSPPPPEAVLKASAQLSFRRLALFFLILDRERLMEKIQIYFPEARYPFKRIYEPKNLNPTMGTQGKTGICVEVCFGTEDGPLEQIKEAMYRLVLEGLRDFFGLHEKEVVCRRVAEVPHAYAVYQDGYTDQLQTLASHLFSMDNLVSYGRQGSFRYNHLVDRVIDSFDEVLQYIRAGKSKEAFLGAPDAKSAFF